MSREADALLDAFEHLSAEERRTFAEEILRRSLLPNSRPLEISGPSRQGREDERWGTKEQEWLRDHWQEYVGRWIALDGSALVGNASSAREALRNARDAGHYSPVLVHITEPSDLPFGGW